MTRHPPAALLLLLTFTAGTLADTPSADYLFPPGGQRGTTVKFRVGAHFLHGGSPFEMSGGGVQAKPRIELTETTFFEGPLIYKPASQAAEVYPKDHLGEVKISADAPPGFRYWRLWTSQGAASGRPFVIGDLPEVVEDEIDGRPIPTRVAAPVTINGRIFPREDVDIWEFEAKKGKSVTCEVMASRISSPLDSRLEIRDPDGKLISENTDHFGSDSFLRFTPAKNGVYQARIHDINYRGLQNYVYRLTITSDAYVDRVFPLGGRKGETVSFTLFGQKTPTQPISVKIPDNAGDAQLHYFDLDGRLSNPVLLDVSDSPEFVEREPNDSANANASLNLPAVLNGRIDKPGDIDVWPVTAKKGATLAFDLGAARFGSALDGALVIEDVSGKQLLRSAATPDNPIEPKGNFKFPADGVYFIRVSDMDETRGGDDFVYRLRLSEPAKPDFQLRLTSDTATVNRGGELKYKVAIDRSGGFKGEVTLRVKMETKDADGVTATEAKIPANKKDAVVSMKAEKTAPVGVRRFTVEGVGKVGEQDVTRRATLPGRKGERSRDNVLLAVSVPTPFKVDGVAFQTRYGARGTVFRRHYVIHRNGFEGPLTIKLADRQIRHQQGVKGTTVIVPPGENEFDYPIRLPTWLEMNRTSRTVVMAVGEVEDEQGNKHKVSFSSGVPKDQIIFLTAPCPMSIAARRQSLRAVPGRTTELAFNISRGVLKPAAVKVELLTARHIKGVVADSVTLPMGQTEGVLQLRFSEPLGPFNIPVVLRATMMNDGDPVIAETKIQLVK